MIFVVDRRLKVDMVGTNSGRDPVVELLGFGDALGGQIGWPEGLRDHDVRVRKPRSNADPGPSLSEVTTKVWPLKCKIFA